MLSGLGIYYKHKMNAYCMLINTTIFPLLFQLLSNIGGFRTEFQTMGS